MTLADIVGITLGGVSLVLSLTLAVLQWRRYVLPMRMTVRVVEVRGGKAAWLVLLQLGITNPATRGRTVVDLRLFQDDESPWEALRNSAHYNFEKGTVVYESTAGGLPQAEFPISNDTVFPMDIPAEGSRVLYLSCTVVPRTTGAGRANELAAIRRHSIGFRALDARSKRLCEASALVLPSMHDERP